MYRSKAKWNRFNEEAVAFLPGFSASSCFWAWVGIAQNRDVIKLVDPRVARTGKKYVLWGQIFQFIHLTIEVVKKSGQSWHDFVPSLVRTWEGECSVSDRSKSGEFQVLVYKFVVSVLHKHHVLLRQSLSWVLFIGRGEKSICKWVKLFKKWLIFSFFRLELVNHIRHVCPVPDNKVTVDIIWYLTDRSIIFQPNGKCLKGVWRKGVT